MTINEAAAKLRPGTAWNLNGDVLEQALDGADRVSIPTPDEIDAYMVANPDSVVPSLQDQVTALQAQVAALLAKS